IAGDMHLDADEAWKVGASIDLFSVALHEAGHALGLAHSDNPNAVMYPFYKQVIGLNADDIAGIQDLYGAATSAPAPAPTPTPLPTPPPTPAPVPALTISIASPTNNATTTSAAVPMIGAAAGGSGALRISWTNDRGGSGAASGSTTWTVASVA